LGDLLRRAREERRWTIADCAARLRIRAPYLAALEAGQYDALPGLTYCVGFVKTYAEFLDLDGPAMVQRFKAEAAGLPLQPSLTLPSPAPAGRIPGGGPLAIAVVGMIALVGGWVFLADDPRSFEIRIPDLPERFAAMVQPRATPLPEATAAMTAAPPDIASKPAAPTAIAPTQVAPTSVPPTQVAPTQVAPTSVPPTQVTATPVLPGPVSPAPIVPTPVTAGPTPAPQIVAAPSAYPPQLALAPPGVPSAAPVAPVQSAALPAPPATSVPAPSPSLAEEGRTPAPQALGGASPLPTTAVTTEEPPRAPPSLAAAASSQPEGRVFGGQNTDARVVLKSSGESWVQIRDRDNSTVFTRLLSAGDSFLVPNRNGLTLWTGNAGVLEVTVDGSSAPSLGAPGAVKKNVSLDADRLKAGTAVGD
jgi:cytoskeleton protein RodZ